MAITQKHIEAIKHYRLELLKKYYFYVLEMNYKWAECYTTNKCSANLKILKLVAEHSKQTKFLKKFIFKLCETIMDLWREHSDKYKLAWRELNMTLSANYLAEKLGKKHGDSKISKGLIILELLGLIEKTASVYQTHKKFLSANKYKFPILNKNIENIVAKAEGIKNFFQKPLNEVTWQKLLDNNLFVSSERKK